MVQATKRVHQRELADLADAYRDVMMTGRRKAASTAHERTVVALLFHLIELGPLRSSDLAERACLDVSTVSRHLSSLESAGYVSRRPDPDDGRAHLIAVTSAGQKVVREGRDKWLAVLADAVAAWSDADRTELTRLTRKLAESLENL